jgi:hypothetical protein
MSISGSGGDQEIWSVREVFLKKLLSQSGGVWDVASKPHAEPKIASYAADESASMTVA